MSKPQPWYADGLRFECQQTGKCCTNHGEYSYVYLNPEDESRLMQHFDLKRYAFRQQHTVVVDGHRALKSTGKKCIFLDGHLCGVHEARPVQCRTWPFWHANLDEKTWNGEVATFCAGVGKGRLHTAEEIEAQADAHDGDDE